MSGHLPSGNPVQRHSAGGTYPYVLVAVESSQWAGRCWRVIGPGTSGRVSFPTHRDAEGYAFWLRGDRQFLEMPA